MFWDELKMVFKIKRKERLTEEIGRSVGKKYHCEILSKLNESVPQLFLAYFIFAQRYQIHYIYNLVRFLTYKQFDM